MKPRSLFLANVLYFNSDIALAADVCLKEVSLKMWVALIWALLKPTSCLIGIIAEKTENKWDNKVAAGISKAISYFGWLIGVFGIGNVPKSIKHRPKIKKEVS